MALGYSTSLRNAQLDAITTAAGNGALLAIYDGTRPSTGGAATTKLVEFTLATPFAPGAAAGVLSPTLPAATNAITSGTATWYRITTSGGTFVMDGSAGASGTDLIMNTATVTAGISVSITAHTITAGNS